MALLYFIHQRNRAALNRDRVFKDRCNPLEQFDDVELIRKFRFPRHIILQLLRICGPHLGRRTKRNHALEPITQLMCALRFYARGQFQDDNGDIMGVTQSSVCRSIRDVTNVLVTFANNFIKFPVNENEINQNRVEFYRMHRIPNIIGLIDGTHIKLKPPKEDEIVYVCRKGGHSVNVQIISDANMKILDVVAKWPGTTHDSFIWQNSALKQKFLENRPNGWLLGDTAYPLEPWLLTPYHHPANEAQRNFNTAHKRTRRHVENCIGLLKSVFRCLDRSGGTLLYGPEKVFKFVIVCVMLHNIRRGLRLREDDEFIFDAGVIEDEVGDYDGILQYGEALGIRDHIANRFE